LLSIIIPCKDEPYLPELIRIIDAYVKIPHEIKVQSEPGLANAILCGVKGSIGDVIVVLDGDGSHNPKYIPQMVEMLHNHDIVIGSRYTQGGHNADYFLRHLLSRFYCKLARSLLRLQVSDTMSGFIVARKEVFDRLSLLNNDDYKFGLEIMEKSKDRFRIAECPVVFEERKAGYSKTDAIQGIRTLAFIFKLFMWKIHSEFPLYQFKRPFTARSPVSYSRLLSSSALSYKGFRASCELSVRSDENAGKS